MDEACEQGPLLARATTPTLSDKLESKRENLEQELASIKRAQEILAENPKFKELFDIVSRVHRL